jgi:putative spermidine/putrescine transport system substrate-binding protein
MFRTDTVPQDTNSWAVIWDKSAPYNGKLSIYDDSIFIADAAVYLKATRPDLKIDNPYELDDKQFSAAVDLLKSKRRRSATTGPATSRSRCSPSRARTASSARPGRTQVNLLRAAKPPVPVKGVKPEEGTTRVVGHLDDLLEGQAPELHVPSG